MTAPAPRFTVQGTDLLRDGRPWRAVGVNYHPSAVGSRIWQDWRPAVVDADLRAMAGHGLTAVRAFVFWRDVEPTAGHHDPVVLQRVRQFVETADRHGLACVLSVFTIWMNGERLDLPWRTGRDPWRDPGMLDHGEAYVRAVAGALPGLRNVLALDLGDEVVNVDPAAAATLTRADVSGWQVRMADAARSALPGVLVCQANDSSGVLGASPFGPDNGAGLDLHAVHGWPLWTPGGIESTSSARASQLPGFLAGYAAAHGPALVDEIGSYRAADDVAAGYLRAGGASALTAGARGVFAWCWQDIASTDPPYDRRPAERTAGMLRLDGTSRAAMTALTDTVRLAGLLSGFEPDPPPVEIYLPRLIREPGTSYLDPATGALGTFFGALLLRRAGLAHRFTTAPAPQTPLVVVPAATRLTLADEAALEAHATGGGTVYLSVADLVGGCPEPGLTGVDPVDFCLEADGPSAVIWSSSPEVRWELRPPTPPRPRLVVRPTTADVLACFADGTPALTRNRVGAGQFVLATFPLELQLERPGPAAAGALHTLYRRVADLAGVPPVPEVPDVEIVTGTAGGARRTVLINHGSTTRRVPGAGPAAAELDLPGKSWVVTGAVWPEDRSRV